MKRFNVFFLALIFAFGFPVTEAKSGHHKSHRHHRPPVITAQAYLTTMCWCSRGRPSSAPPQRATRPANNNNATNR